MNKITNRHIDYSEEVFFTKYYAYEKAKSEYMADRSADNFNRLKRLYDDFQRYNKIHMSKYERLWSRIK